MRVWLRWTLSIVAFVALVGAVTIWLMAKTGSFSVYTNAQASSQAAATSQAQPSSAAMAVAQPSSQTSDTCIFGATNADVQVQVTNDSIPCATQEQALAGDGLSWSSD